MPELFQLRTEAPFGVPQIVVGLHLVPNARRGPGRIRAPQFHVRARVGLSASEERGCEIPEPRGSGESGRFLGSL